MLDVMLVEAFAGQLRALKDRTGRSYEALARRSGLSSSALHRYCAGQALPAEFAPIERFARLCSASGDELLDLHGRWAVALAARAGTTLGTPPPTAIEAPPAVEPDAVPARRGGWWYAAAGAAVALVAFAGGWSVGGGTRGRRTKA